MSGAVSHYAGLAAEDIVARHYESLGFAEIKRRWRGPGGEVDLIVATQDQTVFVEVKQSRNFASAVAHVSARQLQRVESSAAGYMAQLPAGQISEARIDVALVDAQGHIEIIENATQC